MAKTGRPPKATPTVRLDLYLPVDLAAELELLCLDPVTQRQRYGARAQLIEQALREYLDKYRRPMP
jgi:metal-responsive CopG/Arc/MetJ family transcriptional regulator